MRRKICIIISSILLISCCLLMFVACEGDDMQMELMRRGYYVVKDTHEIRANQFEFLDRSKIDWSFQVSVGMFEYAKQYKKGDVIPEIPFQVVYMVKYNNHEDLDLAYEEVKQHLESEGLIEKLLDGPDISIPAIVKKKGLFIYAGTEKIVNEIYAIEF